MGIMGAQSEQLARRVLTLHGEEPHQIREQVLRVLRETFPADYGLYVRLARTEDGSVALDDRQGLYFTGGVYCGDQEVHHALIPFFEGPVVETPWLPPNLRRDDINEVVRTRNRYDADYIDGLRLQQEVFQPLQIGDQMRVLLWDGPRLLGWLGLMRRGEGERFRSGEAEIFGDAVDALRSAILTSVQLERRHLEDGLVAIFTPEGKLDVASKPFSKWVTPERRDMLARRVRRFDATKDPGGMQIMGGAEVHLVRLDSVGSLRYLISVEAAQLFEIYPEYWLTPRQREVARLAIRGATSPEIAQELNLSPQTVKTHMRDIFRRLQIGSRAELASALSS